MPTTLTYAVDAKDYEAYAKYVRRRLAAISGIDGSKYTRNGVGCVLAFGALWLIYTFGAEDFATPEAHNRFNWLVPVMLVLALYNTWCVYYEQLAMNQHVARENGTTLGDYALSLGPDGIDLTVGRLRSWIDWPLLDHVEDAGDHLFLMVDNAAGLIVPKRAFASPEDVKPFVDELHSHMIPAAA